jgi:hypothetical protein
MEMVGGAAPFLSFLDAPMIAYRIQNQKLTHRQHWSPERYLDHRYIQLLAASLLHRMDYCHGTVCLSVVNVHVSPSFATEKVTHKL